MNYEVIYKRNKDYLDSLIRKKYEELYSGKNLFLAGSGVFLGYPVGRRDIDDFTTLCMSKATIARILKDSDVTIKGNISHKVDVLVWNSNSWYSHSDFSGYKAYDSRITWEKFLQPVIDIIWEELNNGSIQ